MTAPSRRSYLEILGPGGLERVQAYGERNGAWGNLHVVLSDGNVDDGNVRACVEDARSKGDTEGEWIASRLLEMSISQRLKIYNERYVRH